MWLASLLVPIALFPYGALEAVGTRAPSLVSERWMGLIFFPGFLLINLIWPLIRLGQSPWRCVVVINGLTH